MPQSPAQHYVFILMGVSGSGKSIVGNRVAQQLSAAYLDGDFLHPRANINKMAHGEPLNDEDREPWLHALNTAAYAMLRTQKISLVVCSALKKKYRDLLRAGHNNLRFIYLQGDFATIEARLKHRKGHFFKPQMLETQFNTLEEPGADETDVITIDINQRLDAVIAEVVRQIKAVTA